MQVILISAKSQNGKDAAAKLIKEELESKNKTVLTIHFGDAVKWLAKDFLNWNGDKISIEGRQILQTLGTDIMRNTFPDYWAELVAKFIAAVHKWDYVIIPDLRFFNELATICKYNNDVIAIRINRFKLDGTPYYNPNMIPEQLSHISECELDDCPFEWIIENRGTLDDLNESIKIFVENIIEKRNLKYE